MIGWHILPFIFIVVVVIVHLDFGGSGLVLMVPPKIAKALSTSLFQAISSATWRDIRHRLSGFGEADERSFPRGCLFLIRSADSRVVS